MRKMGVVALLILFILLLCRPVRIQALDRYEDLLPAVDPHSSLSPVKNLRFETSIPEEGDRRLRILWDRVEGADGYYVLYSFVLDGVTYPNSKLLQADQLSYDPTVLGCGIHTFRVYPLYKNMTCDAVSILDVFVANNTFLPSMLEEGRSVDYYTSAAIELGLQRFQSLALEHQLSGKAGIEKVRTIHNVMCEAIEYSTEESNVYQAILSGKGLCDVYARGFKILCDLSGVACEYITGWAGEDGIEYESHAWNMVELDGAYYHVDTTWDDLENSYRYFLLSDREIEKTHMAETEIRPKASSDRFMMTEGQFSTERLLLRIGETRKVDLEVRPREAAFRARVELQDPTIAECTAVGESISVTARRAGMTSLKISDGENGFDTLWIEVTHAGDVRGPEERKKQDSWLWYLLWGVVFLGCGAGAYRYYMIKRPRDRKN